MDGNAFISSVEETLVPISPIIEFAIRKQLAEIGTTPEDITPKEAMVFIEKMAEAMELFLGKPEASKNRNIMVSLLRKYAPEYFEKRSLI
ncbi:MAG: hypothetical protein R6W91_06625 [Thermoplasmata archaeon]